MQLGVLLLVCAVIMIVFGVLDNVFQPSKRHKWVVFWALCILIAANAHPIQAMTELRVNVASVVLLFTSFALCLRSPQKGVLLGLILGAVGGFAIYVLKLVSLGVEPGLFYGAAAAAIALPLIGSPQAAVLAAVFAPLAADCVSSVADIIYCGYTVAEVGSSLMFDAQIVGLAFVLLTLVLVRIRRSRRTSDGMTKA
ncbi:MAG: hypothetical protein AAGU74_12635 [Bacillota bacterium]